MSVWASIPGPNRRWLLVNALVVTAAINVVLNWAISAGAVRNIDTVPMWGAPLVETSTLWTVIGTLFLLPLFTCVLATTSVRRDMRRGSLAPLELDSNHRWLSELPFGRWRRGAEIGGLAVVILAPPALLALAIAGFPDLDSGRYVAYQVVFAVALGMLVTPPIALAAMADPVGNEPDGNG
jgi:hypothetical protein